MKEIPKCHMQIAILFFGAIIAASSAYAAWHISELRYYMPDSVGAEVSALDYRLKDLVNAAEKLEKTIDMKPRY